MTSHLFSNRSIFCWSRAMLAFGLATCLLSQSIQADLIWLKDGRVGNGRLVSKSEQVIQFRVESFLTDSGATSVDNEEHGGQFQAGQVMVFKDSDVIEVRVNRDEPRLEKLNPRRPAEYLEYAEELALETLDPTAARLAKRLYFLAAAIGDNKVQQSALLGLAAIEVDPKRKQNIELYLTLKTGCRVARNLSSKTNTTAERNRDRDWTTAEARYMLELIRAIRREQSQEAINLLRLADESKSESKSEESELDGGGTSQNPNRDEAAIARAAIERWSSEWTLEQWNSLARAKPMKDLEVRKLLTLEIELAAVMVRITEPQGRGKPNATTNRLSEVRKNWAEQALQSAANSVVLPKLEMLMDPTIGNVNPKATRYRAGVWVE